MLYCCHRVTHSPSAGRWICTSVVCVSLCLPRALTHRIPTSAVCRGQRSESVGCAGVDHWSRKCLLGTVAVRPLLRREIDARLTQEPQALRLQRPRLQRPGRPRRLELLFRDRADRTLILPPFEKYPPKACRGVRNHDGRLVVRFRRQPHQRAISTLAPPRKRFPASWHTFC
jgi:hypothetical protein